ncbi:MAG: membrane protein insertase YidC [Henriciella sp.]
MMQNNGMDPQDQRNFILAMALMIGFILIYQVLVVNPEQARRQAELQAAASVEAEIVGDGGLETAELSIPASPVTIDEAISNDSRLDFAGNRVTGSIRLRGAVLDDLSLSDHYKTINRDDNLRLLRPRASDNGFYASWYWLGRNDVFAGPDDNWTQTSEAELRTDNPVELSLNKNGIAFQRQISVDENYMFTFADTVTNTTTEQVVLRPVGSVRRHGDWKDFLEATDPGSSRKMGLAHQGLIGVLDDRLKLRSYKNLAKGQGIKGDAADQNNLQAGWLGFTDMYWMTALVPQQGETYDAAFNLRGRNDEIMEVTTTLDQIILQPGETVSLNNQIFAGAKEYETVRSYQRAGIPRFEDSIDWGNILYYVTRPFFAILNWLKTQIGSFGLAIMALTLLIKLPLIPLYNQSYKSMAKMKKLAEPMKEIQERFKADPQRRQQEVMKLYQREKANPLAGCVPILFTIPIFFALYKTLYVTIEMRHTPFLFVTDLSAPDPTAIGNLFGLLPIAAADIKAVPLIGLIIGIGILPILYGVTMAAIQSLSPPPPDPTQRTIMMALPFVFMFVFGNFAAGLVLYWVWSNILSLIQQYYIMRRNGVETELDKLIKYIIRRTSAPPAE